MAETQRVQRINGPDPDRWRLETTLTLVGGLLLVIGAVLVLIGWVGPPDGVHLGPKASLLDHDPGYREYLKHYHHPVIGLGMMVAGAASLWFSRFV